jgi:hypothetical protein
VSESRQNRKRRDALSDSKILVVPADLARKIDDNRGDLSRIEFIEALIDNLVTDKPEPKKTAVEYVTRT